MKAKALQVFRCAWNPITQECKEQNRLMTGVPGSQVQAMSRLETGEAKWGAYRAGCLLMPPSAGHPPQCGMLRPCDITGSGGAMGAGCT